MGVILPYDLDDDLLAATARDGEPRVRVHLPPRVMVVLGRGSKVDLELEMSTCQADGVPVLRRRGGGCAVVLDPGNVVVSLSMAVEGIGRNKEHFNQISAWLISALETLGLNSVKQRGISDLCLDELKVGGSCIQRSRGLLFYSTTLLANPDAALISRYLKHPPREPAYRAGRRHADFIGRLEYPGGAASLCQDLERSLDPGSLPGEKA